MEFSRQKQLEEALDRLESHRLIGGQLKAAQRRREEQDSHIEGLYNEVDKLAKGKSMLPATDLTVELSNSLISDSKALVYGDVYLDRLKLFVPAGDNPSYPDVLLSIRVLKQVLARFGSLINAEVGAHQQVHLELLTIHAALQEAQKDEIDFYELSDEDADLETTVDEGDEAEAGESVGAGEDNDEYIDEDDGNEVAYEEYVRKTDVARRLDGVQVAADWFRYHDRDSVFNFEKLDLLGFPEYTPPSDGITFVRRADG